MFLPYSQNRKTMIWTKRTVAFATILVINAVSDITSAVMLIANIHANGVKGLITFNQANAGQDTIGRASVMGLSNSNAWTIRSLRVKYDVDNRCSRTGSQYTALTGRIPSSGIESITISKNSMNDLRILCGRAILLIDSVTGKTACGNLEEDGNHFTAVARFQSHIAGTVVFRQSASSETSCTSVFLDLFRVTNTSNAAESAYKWFIHGSTSVTSTCSNPGSIHNPKSSSGSSCSFGSHENCKMGDLSGKHGDIKINVTSGENEAAFVDLNLSLSGSHSIANQLVVIKNDGGDIVACAKIKIPTKQREAKAMFSRNGITGTINFSQMSVYDPATVHIDLKHMKSLAGGYHVHEWPVQQKLDASEDVCDGESVSGHFDPFHASGSPPTGTNDQYEVGDLSGKFGSLKDKNTIMKSYVDYNLPLFGRHSIIGRSLVIHKHADGTRWTCATIQPNYNTKKAVAVFKHKVIGRIALMQAVDDWEMAETQIFVELNYANSLTATVDHKWHIHTKNMTTGTAIDSAERCNSVKGHYNPFSVDLEGNYGSACNGNNPLRCELGDLSGKHGKINVRTNSKKMWRAFFTDVDLPLSGPESVLARSVVIHDANNGGGRLSCADFNEMVEVMVKVSSWDDMMPNTLLGTITFTENSMGFLEGITNVDIDVKSLSSVDGFHVHKYPVPFDNTETPCDQKNIGGHFAPLAVTGSPQTGTDDQYEVGDLSGKYGHPMKEKTNLKASYIDTNLPLRGVTSIVGRSIVIHKEDGARWVCGNIVNDVTKTKAKLYNAIANFTEGPLRGYIKMTQYQYLDGTLSDTQVLVDLTWANDSSLVSRNHKWHVHEKSIGDDASSGCLSTGPHFNPYMVDTQNGYDECSRTNPLRCELGDQSSKLGTYDIGDGPRFYTDVNLDLVDQFAGRSFVVHKKDTKDADAARLACADIIPDTKFKVTVAFRKPAAFRIDHVMEKIRSALKTYSWNVVLEKVGEGASCMVFNVYLTGNNDKDLKNKFSRMLNHHDPSLRMFENEICGTGELTYSAILLLAGLLLYKITWIIM